TVALVESNTGGQVAQRLGAAISGYAAVKASWRIGDTSLPLEVQSLLPNGDEMAGEEQIQAAAVALLRTTGSDLAIVMLGTSGADEGMYGAASGHTWLALAAPDGVQTLSYPFGGQDDPTVTRIGNQALGLLWKRLSS